MLQHSGAFPEPVGDVGAAGGRERIDGAERLLPPLVEHAAQREHAARRGREGDEREAVGGAEV
jgi:hypothetical protein